MGDSSWSIRPATVHDAATLADIVVEASKEQGRWPRMTATAEAEWRAEYAAWGAEQVEAAEPGNVLIVIEGDGQAVGRLRIVREIVYDAADQPRVRRLELAGIQLRPACQRRGIGTAIIRELQREAIREQIPLELRVEKDNPYARRLYERLGFSQIGEIDAEYLMQWIGPS